MPRPRLRRRLTWAFLLVAGVCAGALAAGSYALVYQARLSDSVDHAVTDARYQLVLAGQFTPLDAARRTALLRSFESAGRSVVLVVGDAVQSAGPHRPPALPPRLRAAAADGELAFHRVDAGGRRLLLVGGRIPGSAAELY
ncbi:MAG: sensor histidine kinase, partial [Micromonosporaceae bacterium]